MKLSSRIVVTPVWVFKRAKRKVLQASITLRFPLHVINQIFMIMYVYHLIYYFQSYLKEIVMIRQVKCRKGPRVNVYIFQRQFPATQTLHHSHQTSAVGYMPLHSNQKPCNYWMICIQQAKTTQNVPVTSENRGIATLYQIMSKRFHSMNCKNPVLLIHNVSSARAGTPVADPFHITQVSWHER